MKPGLSTTLDAVTVFSSTAEGCGIGDYARRINGNLQDRFTIRVVSCEGLDSMDDFAAAGELMNRGTIAHVHYEHGFFTANERLEDNTLAFFNAIRVPVICSFHCLPFFELADWSRRLLQGEFHAVVHSGRHADLLRQSVPGVGVSIIHLPAISGGIADDSIASMRSRHAPEGQRLVTISGFIKQHKGYELVIRALNSLSENVKLLIAGGPQTDEDRAHLESLQRLIADFGLEERVEITGYLSEPELQQIIKASDIVIAPFRSMTASASLADAYAAGRPVIASDLPQCVELAECYGGMKLFRQGEVNDLIDAINLLLDDAALYERLVVETGRYRKACSLEKTSARIGQIYLQADGRS